MTHQPDPLLDWTDQQLAAGIAQWDAGVLALTEQGASSRVVDRSRDNADRARAILDARERSRRWLAEQGMAVRTEPVDDGQLNTFPGYDDDRLRTAIAEWEAGAARGEPEAPNFLAYAETGRAELARRGRKES